MNLSSKILISTCTLLLVSPISIMACDPDCVDCYFWNGEYCEPRTGVECNSWTDCPNGGWCCDCPEPDCECVMSSYWCLPPWYSECHVCDSCGCACDVVTSVGGLSGPYAVGGTATVTAQMTYPRPQSCPISWSSIPYGAVSFWPNPSLSTSTTATFLRAGWITVSAQSCCQLGWTSSSSVAVVRVGSLVPDRGTWFDDGDGDPNTNSYEVPGSYRGIVNVRATPDPNVSEAELPSCWELIGATGTGKLTRTVNMGGLIDSDQPSTYYRCTCGPSYKELTIYVQNPVTRGRAFGFDKQVNGIWYLDQSGAALIGGWYRTVFRGWDSCLTSGNPRRKFLHMHADRSFPFPATIPGVGAVLVNASDSDHWWTRTQYPASHGYAMVSGSTFSQNCHGYAQGKGYWIDDPDPLLQDDYELALTGGQFQHTTGHSIRIDSLYENYYYLVTTEKWAQSGVYRLTYDPNSCVRGTVYTTKQH